MLKDPKKIGVSLAVAAGAASLAGLLTRDKYAVVKTGLSGFDGVKQGLGKTTWVVSLDKELVVAPCDVIPWIGTWVILDSLITALADLETEALEGKQLGTLENILQRLQQSTKLIYLALPN
jgi:hypothetical protein